MMDDYPEKPCPDHPSRMWEWDAYGWICFGCVLNDPKEPEPMNKAE